jgi:hypothetical protein
VILPIAGTGTHTVCPYMFASELVFTSIDSMLAAGDQIAGLT